MIIGRLIPGVIRPAPAAESRRCPQCGAEPGRRCWDSTWAKPVLRPHFARRGSA